jgi:predicted glutamine amidotransferase
MVNESQSGQYCYLNFILTNGKTSLAVRFTTDAPENAYSLYLNYGKRYTCENGVCYMEDQKEDEKAILVSSEPLTKDGGWESIQANHMILIKDHELIDYKSIWN